MACIRQARRSETLVLLTSNVTVVARPNANALVAVLLTASKGHSPNSLTSAGLSCHSPCTHSLRNACRAQEFAGGADLSTVSEMEVIAGTVPHDVRRTIEVHGVSLVARHVM